jgi:hypothetical protein
MTAYRQRTGSFKAIDDQGKEYKIVEYTDFIDAATLADNPPPVQGQRALKTSDGRSVNQVAEGVYEIVGHPMIRLKAIDEPLEPIGELDD